MDNRSPGREAWDDAPDDGDPAPPPKGRDPALLVGIVVACLVGGALLLGTVVALVGPRIVGRTSLVRKRAAETHMRNFEAAIDMYTLRHKRLPASLASLTVSSEDEPYPYMKSIPDDPWGNAYEYQVVDRRRYRIVSRGPDGVAGSEDDIVWPREP